MSFVKQDLDAVAPEEFAGPALQRAASNSLAAREGRTRRYSVTWPADLRPVLWGSAPMAWDLGPVLIHEDVAQITRVLQVSVVGASVYCSLAALTEQGLTTYTPETEVEVGDTSATLTLDTSALRGEVSLWLLVRSADSATLKTYDCSGGAGHATYSLGSPSRVDLSHTGFTFTAGRRYVLDFTDHSTHPETPEAGYPARRHLVWIDDLASPDVARVWPYYTESDDFQSAKYQVLVTEVGALTLYGYSHDEARAALPVDLRDNLRPGLSTKASTGQALADLQRREHADYTICQGVFAGVDRGRQDIDGEVVTSAGALVTYDEDWVDAACAYLGRHDTDQARVLGVTYDRRKVQVLFMARLTQPRDPSTFTLSVRLKTSSYASGAWGTDEDEDTTLYVLGGAGLRGEMVSRRAFGGDPAGDLAALDRGGAPVAHWLQGHTPAQYLTPAHDFAGWRLVSVQGEGTSTENLRQCRVQVKGELASLEGQLEYSPRVGARSLWVGPVSVWTGKGVL